MIRPSKAVLLLICMAPLAAVFTGCGSDDATSGSGGAGGARAGAGGTAGHSGASTAGGGSGGAHAGSGGGGVVGDAGEGGALGVAGAIDQGGAAGAGEAGSGEGGEAGAGAPAPVCVNDVALPLTSVFEHFVTDAAPLATGGPIIDGTYVLTAYTHYSTAVASIGTDLYYGAAKVEAGTIARVAKTNAAAESRDPLYTFPVGTTTSPLALSICGAGPFTAVPYTTTVAGGITTFTIFIGDAFTYTKL